MSVYRNLKYIKLLIFFLIASISIPTSYAIDDITGNAVKLSTNESSSKYYLMLDKLAKYQTLNAESLQSIVNEFLKYYGYPENLVKVSVSNINQSRAKFHNSYQTANFNFQTGTINVSEKVLSQTDIKKYIAVIGHELDHFIKLANLCKAIGINEFQALFEKNNVRNIDTAFWQKAGSYSNIADFQTQYYKTGLIRLLTQNQLELTSSYSDIYKMTESIRNPLEVSAYKVSDNIYKYYNIPIADTQMKRLADIFNIVDNEIYSVVSNTKGLEREQTAVFDYLYAQSIIKKMPYFLAEYDKCLKQKQGDMTSFWLDYEKSIESFYSKGAMTQGAYDKVYSLLEDTAQKAKFPLNQSEILLAFKFKINTLYSNLVYPNAVKYLRTFIIDYLSFLNRYNITTESEQELKSILILLCIDNQLYKSNSSIPVKVSELKIPNELNMLYNAQNTISFVYKLSAFSAKKSNATGNENLLADLLNQTRLDIRINK